MDKQDQFILRAANIHKSFTIGREQLQVLRGGTLDVKRGEFIAIMGASGSGKSTLLHILGLLDRPDAGQVYFDGQKVFSLRQAALDRIRNRDIGFVFQFYHLLPELTLEENVLLPAMVAHSIWSWPAHRQQLKERATELISTLGLQDRARQWPATLSGGERQRTAIARALMQHPRLLLADEPTGNLDFDAGKRILNHLTQLNKAGQTIVMVTHDLAVAQLADRRLRLTEGRLTAIN